MSTPPPSGPLARLARLRTISALEAERRARNIASDAAAIGAVLARIDGLLGPDTAPRGAHRAPLGHEIAAARHQRRTLTDARENAAARLDRARRQLSDASAATALARARADAVAAALAARAREARSLAEKRAAEELPALARGLLSGNITGSTPAGARD